jgi:hypothetical protein
VPDEAVSETTQVTKPTLDAINALPGGKAIKVHGSVYAESGTPDIDAVVDGVPYKFECKLPGEPPTVIQRKRLREWRDAGAVAGVIYSKAEALAIIAGDADMRRVAVERFDS